MASMDLKTIVGLFIFLIVAIVLASAVGDKLFLAQTPSTVINENVSIQTLRTSTGELFPNVTTSLANDDIISIDGVEWMNGTAMVLNTDYYLNDSIGTGRDAPRVSFQNTSISGGYSNITSRLMNFTSWNYTHAGDNYIQGSSINRTFIGLILIFFVIGILTFIIAMIKKSDIFNY